MAAAMVEEEVNSSELLDCMSSYASVLGIAREKIVVVHPIVLLSIADHFQRVSVGSQKRVVGTLLGSITGNEIHVTNSFAVPFEQDNKDPKVWYLDHNYHEHLFRMFKKVNTRERILGWYSTGPDVCSTDLEIHETFRKYTTHPLYVIVDMHPKDSVVPAKAYFSFEEPTSDKAFRRTFVHVGCTIGAYEAEEVGVEHLLRDLKNASTSTLAMRVSDDLNSLKMLTEKLEDICSYLKDAQEKKIPTNPTIIYTIQDIFNLLPDLSDENLQKCFAVQSNDNMLGLYLGSVVRSVLALHNLINNKIDNKRALDANKKDEKKSDEDDDQDGKKDGLDKSKKDACSA